MMNLIKPGHVFAVDTHGYVVNETTVDLLQDQWRAALDLAVAHILTKVDPDPLAIYVRGTVALGRAIEGVSDLDLFLLFRNQPPGDPCVVDRELNQVVKARFPFVTQVDLEGVSPQQLAREKRIRMGLKTQSLRLVGEDVIKEIEPFKPGIDMVVHALQLAANLAGVQAYLLQERDTKRFEECSKWLGKLVVRSGFELVMERAACYTRDLYPCYHLFSQFYPEWEPLMYRFLELAIEPRAEVKDIVAWLDSLGPWLCEEIKTELGLALIIAQSRQG